MNSLNSTGNFWMDKGLAAMISLAFVLGSIMLGMYFS